MKKLPTIVACVITVLAARASAAQERTLGRDVEVGSFRLHVQMQRQRVDVQRLAGAGRAAVPMSDLLAEFVSWDRGTGIATISVAFRNVGAVALFGPVRATTARLASPHAVALNADLEPATWVYEIDPLPPTAQTDSRAWTFQAPGADFQVDVVVLAGVPVRAGQGATITSADGSRIRVLPGSVPYDALVDVEMVSPSSLIAPTGDLQVVGAVQVTFEPTLFSGSFEPPSLPFVVSIPATSSLTSSQYVVAQQVVIDPVPARRAPQTMARRT